MGQSLSEISRTPTGNEGRSRGGIGFAFAAAGISLVLAAVAVVDQFGSSGLMHHAERLYGSHGVDVSSGLVYGLLYTVAAVNALAWLGVALGATTKVRWHFIAATAAASVITLGMGIALLTAREYGGQVFPTRWGLFAMLPLVPGVLGLLRIRR